MFHTQVSLLLLSLHSLSSHSKSFQPEKVFKVHLSPSEQKRHHCGHNETQSRKMCLFVLANLKEVVDNEVRDVNLAAVNSIGCETRIRYLTPNV